MSREYPAKIFRSGNSMAMRLPKALGLAEGDMATIVQDEDGGLMIKLADKPKRKFNVAKVVGSVPGLRVIPDEERLFEEPRLTFD